MLPRLLLFRTGQSKTAFSLACSRSAYTRQQLVDWIISAHGGLKLDEETLHLAVRYVDTFLTRRGALPEP